MTARQLPLGLRWPSHQRLDAFLPDDNPAALQLVRASVESGVGLFLQGAHGAGKTHLLIGACRAAVEAGRNARYLPLASLPAPRAAAVAGVDSGGLIAIDDVQAIAGDNDAERALFDLYHRASDHHATLLFAGSGAPAHLGLILPDVVSRLSACTQCVLRAMDESGRRAVLQARACQRGLQLDDNVLDWLFARQPRDLGALIALFERLDHAALVAQRRVTIPFLRGLLTGKNDQI
ncbi:MAG: DnaA regulatory inactivator Hda [Rhodanobacteraceae bacterium]|nr:DnaA regulatory inactivator Hda [Pseudomonadota bacterium]